MSLIKLTQNLENFKWTDYSKTGTGKSPQPDRTDYFERPNPKSLEQMESKFGKLDTQPTTRGPYGVSNTMDGTKQGRGFIPPGSTPSGFTKDMDLLHNPSELAIGQNLTRTPLSYEVAGVTSNLYYGQVDQKELNLEPQAEGAYGVTTLPISTYSSRQPIEDIPVGAIGGYNTYYGNLDLLSSRTSKFQKPDGSYSTPEDPSFEDAKGGQRTFLIPAAYPKNTTAYSINTQFGWTHQSNYLESHGAAWRGFGLTTTAKGQMDEAGYGDVTPDFYPPLPEQSQTPHPMNRIYLNSEPAYGAPSWLETQFNINYGVTDGIWPYKVLGFTGTHPLIRKDIGERYQIGGIESWMGLQVLRASDDIQRVEKWLNTPKGELWVNKQQILQELNPREETRFWSESNLLLSVPPLFHAKRHHGETYMEIADFGPIFEGDPPVEGGPTLRSNLVGKYPGLVGPLNTMDEGMGWLESGLDKISSALGVIDFNEQGAGGRLRFFRDKFIAGDSAADTSLNLGGISVGNLLNTSAPFGRTPVIPTQTTFSQRGAYGGGSANENVLKNSSGTVLQRYKTLSYGDLNQKNAYYQQDKNLYDYPLLSAGEAIDYDPFDEFQQERDTIRADATKVVMDIGSQGRNLDPEIYKPIFDDSTEGAGLGIINKGADGTYNNELTDKINMLPYGKDYKDAKDGAVNDFIKFKFYDIENKKHIIFRAILSGISDSITPEWSGTRYIGRPDQVYVYSGTERKISFTFEIYPKTKQEFPVLLEKMNYLVGLCYPSYTSDNRMIAPFIELTLGDMFNKTPGFLDSLSVDVDDTGTWEIEEGLQFPKHITCGCSFTYVGKYLPSSLGKHYELGWLVDKGWGVNSDSQPLKGTFEGEKAYPTRIQFGGEKGSETFNVDKLFSDLGASSAE